MSELEYRNRSISELVSELNHLGEPNVLLSPLRLIAVHEKDMADVKRYKNSHGDQFFIPANTEKKYSYSEVTPNISSTQFDSLQQLFGRGFSLSLLFGVPREQGRLTQLLSQVARMVGHCACSSLCFSEQGIFDAVSGNKLTERDLEARLKYYRVPESNLITFLDRVLRGQKGVITLAKLRPFHSNSTTHNQINLISLPEQMFSPALKLSDFLGVCRSQLTQIFNYIKLNPANKYQHFSKLVTKRLPVTNILASLILEQTATCVVNWMNEGGPGPIRERLSFYDKMRELSVLLKKEKEEAILPIVAELPDDFHSSRLEKQKKRQTKTAKTDRTPIAAFQEESELDYCRSFERKTHKYSINDVELFGESSSPFQRSRQVSNTPSPVTHFPPQEKAISIKEARFDETMPRRQPEGMRESEQVAILKANHAVEVSQYHQTIQELNKKILVLVSEQGLEELYTIHERELMLLELKIKELRNDISQLCQSNDEKSCKSMVRRLNEEIKRLQSRKGEQKASTARTIILEKQLNQLSNKYQESEKARQKLTYELQTLTKRLQICDTQIQTFNNKEEVSRNLKSSNESGIGKKALSMSESEGLKEIEALLRAVEEGNQQARGFLMRKIMNTMTDLSSCRNIILECNDFLVQLEEHLESTLASKEPQIVLDCNKFIRTFLMQNMNIF